MKGRLVALGGVAALALGAACILLGRAVLAEPARLDAARASLATPDPSVVATSGGGVTSTLLGTGGDRAALAAAGAAARARTLASALHAEKQLALLAATGPGDRRSWAASLVGALEIGQAQLGGRGAKQHVTAAVAALEAAVAADPANENAKRNLELLLTLQQKGQRHRQQRQQRQGRHSRQARARAGYAAPGWGW